MAVLSINPQRFREDFEALAQIGATGDGGVDRPTFSPAHLQAREWFAQRIRQANLEMRRDGAGNHSAFLDCGPAGGRTLLLGSHLDSVTHGGRFDGALGVLAALEVLRTVQEAGLKLPVHLEAIDFTDEEGTLFGLLGSAALAGHLQDKDLLAPRGGRQALLDGLMRVGLSEAGLLSASRDPVTLAGYLELHIEQGPRLLQAGAQIGVVSAIVGICSYRLAFTGRADHAGTTPMSDRLDAAQGAAAFTLAVRQAVMRDFPGCVANVGQMYFEPGAFNIVPARAVLSLELRAADDDTFASLETALLDSAHLEAERGNLGLEIEFLGKHAPALMSNLAQNAIAQASKALGLRHISLPSGAGHDAQMLAGGFPAGIFPAGLCPAGMIFVPSQGGASHSPREFTEWQDCVYGANVLLGAALRMAVD